MASATNLDSISTNSTNLTCVDIKASPISDLLVSVFILAFVFGLIFNVLTLCPIWHQVKQQNVLGIFLLSLSISDLFYIITLPLWINYYLNDHNWQLPVVTCSVAGFFYYSNMYISIFLLCCISVDRSLLVCYPLHFKIYRTSRYAWFQSAAIYIIVVMLHIIILIKDNIKDAHDDNNNHDRCYENYPIPDNVAIFNMVRVAIGFLLPLAVLTVSYWKILATVDKSPGLNVQAKRKVRLLSYGVIGIFSVCYAPYHILLLVRSVVHYSTDDHSPGGSYCKFEQNMHFPFSCTLALSSLNCVVDPVLYALVSYGIRDKMRLCLKVKRQSAQENCALTSVKDRSSNLI